MDEIVGVEIKQEQDSQEICPDQDWLEILPEIIKPDLDGVVKTEDYCTNYDEDCGNNLPNENRLFLKEENASLGVAEDNSVNKIDIDQHEVPTYYVILKYKDDYNESACKEWMKEEQGIERRENALDEKILVHQKLDPPKMFPKVVTHLNTEIDVDNFVVKSKDQFCINCNENSSDNLPSENGLVSNYCPSVEAVQSSETLESEYDSDVKNLVNKFDCDHKDISRQSVHQENVELQTDIELKRVEKRKKDNRNKTSVSTGKRFKCQYCDYETQISSHFKEHVLAIHEKRNAKEYYCQLCTFKTVRARALRVHFRVHEEKAPYKCPGCDKSCNHKVNLDNHMLTNHENLLHLVTYKINYCKFCTYKTIYLKDLTRHIAHNHNRDNAEKFQCYKCDYFALEKHVLRRHLQVHSDTRPYLCTLCNKRYNYKKSLDSHILSSHEENVDLLKSITNKFYQCTICSYKTISNRNLHTHMDKKHK